MSAKRKILAWIAEEKIEVAARIEELGGDKMDKTVSDAEDNLSRNCLSAADLEEIRLAIEDILP